MLLSLFSTMTFAYDIAAENGDGKTIYYNYSEDGTELIVTFGLSYLYANAANRSSYTGDLVIPEEVTIMNRPRKVTAIGYDAFVCCSNLTSVTIPNSITSIGDEAFAACTGLTSVVVPNSVTSFGAAVFTECENLVSVTIGNKVTEIGGATFNRCYSLTSVVLPDSVTSIGASAFQYCRSLASITIPNNVNSIGKEAFRECTSLTNVNIPDSVVSIGNQAFLNCRNLTSVTIGSGLNDIGTNTFKNCSSILSIVVSQENTKYDSRDNCNAVIETEQNTLVVGCRNSFIPNSVTSIGNDAFDGCSRLTAVTIPDSVTSIGRNAFNECSGLTSVTIPKNVTLIGDKAFYCENLAEVVSLNDNPSIIGGKSSGTFHLNTFNNATLYVPVGTKDIYREKAGWKDFAFIEEGTGSGSGSSEGEGATEPERCATPTISFANGELTFSCETEDVEYVYNITTEDVKNGIGSKVKLGGTYKVSVYAIKQGYKNSNVATLEFTIGAGGEVCDVNKDGAVDVADIATIIDEMAARARMQKEAEE